MSFERIRVSRQRRSRTQIDAHDQSPERFNGLQIRAAHIRSFASAAELRTIGCEGDCRRGVLMVAQQDLPSWCHLAQPCPFNLRGASFSAKEQACRPACDNDDSVRRNARQGHAPQSRCRSGCRRSDSRQRAGDRRSSSGSPRTQ